MNCRTAILLISSLMLALSCVERKPPSAGTNSPPPAPQTPAQLATQAGAFPAELPGDKEIRNSEVAYNLALEYFQKGEVGAAHHYTDLAHRMQPSSKYLYMKGLCHIAEQRFDLALPPLEEAYRMGAGTPDNAASILNALGVCLMHMEKDDAALEKFREVVNMQGPIRKADAYYNMGVIYLRQQKSADAEAVFSKVVEENPGRYEAFNKLGLLRAARGSWEDATRDFKRAIGIIARNSSARRSDGPEIHFNCGEALFQRKMYREAREHLNEAVKLSPEGPFGLKAKALLIQLGGY